MSFALPKPAEASIDWMDRLAVGASFACLVHCIGLPLIVAALPALTSFLTLPETFHLWVLLLAIPTAGLALISGTRSHANRRPLLVGTAGLTLLASAALALNESRGGDLDNGRGQLAARHRAPVELAPTPCLPPTSLSVEPRAAYARSCGAAWKRDRRL